jgi:hypothetical protein
MSYIRFLLLCPFISHTSYSQSSLPCFFWCIKLLYASASRRKLAEAVLLLTCIHEVPGLNPIQDTKYPVMFLVVFLSAFKWMPGQTWNMPWTFLSMSFPINRPSTPFSVVWAIGSVSK